MDNFFGLSILLEYEDKATSKMMATAKAFNNTKNSAEELRDSLAMLQEMSVAGFGMQNIGNSLTAMSNSILQDIKDMGKAIIDNGDYFEKSTKTLKALYKSEDVAKQKVQWGLDLASTTPFEIPDVMESMIGLKAAGVEADKQFESVNGEMRTFLEYVGDLASLRPDIGMGGTMLGIRNLIGGDGGRSLRARLDINAQDILGRAWGDTPEQIMKDIVELSQKIASNLMSELKGTWGQIVSNLKNHRARFLKGIADNNAFESAKKSLIYFNDMIEEIDAEGMNKIGKSLAQVFTMIWKPIDLVVRGLTDLTKIVKDLVINYPILGKIVFGLLTLIGVVAGGIGIIFKFLGGTILTISSLGTFIILMSQIGGLANIFTTLKSVMSGFFLGLLKYVAIAGIIYLAWRTNFMGIRNLLTNFMQNTHKAFSESSRIANLGISAMIKEINHLNNQDDFFSSLTFALVKLKVLWLSVVESWNTNELSDETFNKVKTLGLLPLLEFILDLKMLTREFFDGFKKGFLKANEIVEKVINKTFSVVYKVVRLLDKILRPFGISILDTFNKLQSFGDFDSMLETTNDLGKVVGSVVHVLLMLKALNIVGGILKTLKIFKPLIVLGSKLIGGISKLIKIVLPFVMSHPFIALAIGAVIAFMYIYNKSELVRQAVDLIIEWVKFGLESIVNTVILIGLGIVETVVAVGGTILLTVGVIVASIITVIMSIVGIVMSIGAVIVGIVETGVAIFSGIFLIGYEIIKGITETFLAIFNAIVTGDFSRLGETLKSIWSGVWERIKEIVRDTVAKIKDIWSGVVDFFNGIWEGIKEGARSMFSWLADKFSWVTDTISKISGAMSDIGGGITEGYSNLKQSTKSFLGLSTGGEVNGEGLAYLHPNEVVVNGELTQQLRDFLANKGSSTSEIINNSKSSDTLKQEIQVVLESGAIQLELPDTSPSSAKEFIDLVITEIKRRKELENISMYKELI